MFVISFLIDDRASSDRVPYGQSVCCWHFIYIKTQFLFLNSSSSHGHVLQLRLYSLCGKQYVRLKLSGLFFLMVEPQQGHWTASANYHQRVLALLRGLGTPTHLPSQPVHLGPGASGVCVCVGVWASRMYVFVRLCVCDGLWMIPRRSPWCRGLVKHFLGQLCYLSCHGGSPPPPFLWNETIWETSRHLIWRLIRLFRGQARACVALMV